MFVSKKLSQSKWKQRVVGLVGNTISSADQAVSGWFWNLINNLPRDYFAKTFDQVNYLDKRVWEGVFRLRIEELKEQLESGLLEGVFEADIIRLQGLVGKYSLSPIIYEDGLKGLEDFISNLDNPGNYLKILTEVRNEFREELKAQPSLLKGCIQGDANLGRREADYYNSLLNDKGNLRNTSSKKVPAQLPVLDKAVINRKENNSSKLRNISKLLFGSPAQAVTLFLAAQVTLTSAVNTQLRDCSTSITGNSTSLPIDQGIFSTLKEIKSNAVVFKDKFMHSSNPESEARIAFLWDKSRRLEDEATRLAGQIVHNSSHITSIREKVEALKSEFESLKIQLKDEQNKALQPIEQCGDSLPDLTSTCNALENQVEKLDRESKALAKLPDECIAAIKSNDFRTAETKLELMSDDNKVNSIVSQVYNNQADNFDLILRFGDSVRNIRKSFLVYKALDYEMGSNGHKDPFKMIKLAESLNREVISYTNTPFQTKREAESLISGLKGTIKAATKEKLKNGMLNDRYASVKEIADKVYNFDSTLFGNAIKEAVDDIYGRVDTEKILSLIRNHSGYIPQIIQGCAAVFDNMRRNSGLSLNDNTVGPILKLSSLVKEIMEMPNYRNINSQHKSELENLKRQLPDVKSLAKEKLKDGMLYDRYASVKEIADKVYNFDSTLFGNAIKEAVNDVYGRVDTEKILSLIRSHSYIEQSIPGYAAIFDKMQSRNDLNNSVLFKLAYYIKETMGMDNYPNVHSEKRSDLENVKSSLPKSIKNSVFSSKVCIKNVRYGEYLFADLDRKYDDGRRYAFTFIPGGKPGDGSWEIEPEREHFLIKNGQYSEYLYAANDDLKYDGERRSVFTWTPGGAVIQGRWQFEPNGDNVHIRNTEHSEYLFADLDRKYDDDRRYAFTFIPGEKTWNSLWLIEDCSNERRRRDVKAIEAQDSMSNATVYGKEIEEDVKPSSHVSDIALESIKTTERNSSLSNF